MLNVWLLACLVALLRAWYVVSDVRDLRRWGQR